ncbi:hypothetical protein PIB30_096197 [Stylosanthes scabra]|uniref:Uncharacterized protein n=1 Tax=Stylosanthes scabra TaxID=79078 RepID=A0ABU6QWK8_9FABA|nr:hypothetical protein [Stylosanthes scabra]
MDRVGATPSMRGGMALGWVVVQGGGELRQMRGGRDGLGCKVSVGAKVWPLSGLMHGIGVMVRLRDGKDLMLVTLTLSIVLMEDQRRGCSHPWKKLYWHFSLKQTDEECKRLWKCVEILQDQQICPCFPWYSSLNPYLEALVDAANLFTIRNNPTSASDQVVIH